MAAPPALAPALRPARGSRSALAALILLAGCGGQRLPDVVLVSLDSVRADALTFRDPTAAPRLSALARDGTVFQHAVSGSSWTLPAHAQLFTGQPPVLHGVQYDDVKIDPLTPTLPELLDRAGYFTAGFWTGWYLAGEYGFDRGFDAYRNAMTDGDLIERQYRQAVASQDFDRARAVLSGRDRRGHQDITSPRVVEGAREVIGRARAADPLFLFLHLFDPHYDYVPPPPWDRRFDPDYAGTMDGRDFYENTAVFDPDARPRRRISDRDLRHVVALYRGEIGWTDAAVGEVLDALDEAGRLEDAIVIVTADHGDEFFEHGGRGHRHSLYDELLRVPLLVRLPQRLRPAPLRHEVEEPVGLSDVLPTVLDALGLDAPPSVVGRSLLPAIRGEDLAPLPLVSTLSPNVGGGNPVLLDGVRAGRWKLLRQLAVGQRSARPRVKLLELYDLSADPRELHPVTDASHPEVRRLSALLDAELERFARLDLPRTPDALRATRVREVFEDELGKLGYGEGSSSHSFAHPWGLAPHPPPAPARQGEGGD